VVEEFKVTKARLVMTLRHSRDDKIREAVIRTRTGRKWSAGQSVEQAETMLKLRDIVGATCSGDKAWEQLNFSSGKRQMHLDEEAWYNLRSGG